MSNNELCEFNIASDKLDITDHNKVLNSCFLLKFTFIKELGTGAYGLVFLYEMNSETDKIDTEELVAVKYVKYKLRTSYLKKLHSEFDNMVYMDKIGIGPKIFGAFYITGIKYLHEYFIMKSYDSDVKTAIFEKKKMSLKDKLNIILLMLNLLRKQIFDYNFYCSDIKPTNFVVDTLTLEVRMIDFGPNKCTDSHIDNIIISNNHSKRYKNEVFYLVQIILLYVLFKHYIYKYYTKYGRRTSEKLVKPILDDPIYRNRYAYKEDFIRNATKNKLLTFYHYCKNLNDSKLRSIFFSEHGTTTITNSTTSS